MRSRILACARDARLPSRNSRSSEFRALPSEIQPSRYSMLACSFAFSISRLARRSWQACLLQLSCTCGLTFAACEQLRAWSDLRCCAVFECDLVREVSLSASHSPLPSALLTRRLPVRSRSALHMRIDTCEPCQTRPLRAQGYPNLSSACSNQG